MKNIQVFKPIYRKQEILNQIGECLDKGWSGMGFKTDLFEEEFKKYTGFKYCYSLNSATAGLDLAVKQLKQKYSWEDTDEIITTPITFVSSNHSILYNHMIPVFSDIDESGCINPKDILKKINPKTKAIMFVGLGGNAGKLKEVIEIAKIHNLKLILDAAHCCGTLWKDTRKQIGTEEGIDVTIFSFQAVKNLPTADMGAICWNGENAEELDKQSRRLGWLGITKSTFDRTTAQGSYKWHYEVNDLGYKYHNNSIMASIALVSLKYLEQDNAYRRYLCDLYQDLLKDVVEFVPHNPDCISSRHLIQILVDKRDEVMLALNQCDIFPGVHYRTNTLYPMYFMPEGSLPNAESFSNRTITLPLHMHLTVDDVKYVATKLKEILNK